MPAVLEKNIKGWLLEVIKPQEFNEKNLKSSGILFEAVVAQNQIRDVAKEFLAQIIVLQHPNVLTKGYTPVFHVHTSQTACKITEIEKKLDPNSGSGGTW